MCIGRYIATVAIAGFLREHFHKMNSIHGNIDKCSNEYTIVWEKYIYSSEKLGVKNSS